MKKLFIIAALMVAAFSSCSGVDDVPVEDAGAKQFTFTVKGDFKNPTFSRANANLTADGVEMTDLWVVDVKNGKVEQELHQSYADSDWGKPTVQLTLGEHHIYFLASRGQNPEYEDGMVTWTKPLDTFWLDYEITVNRASSGNKTVTLNRVATKLQIYIEDAIANGTTNIIFEPSVWYNGWDMIAGEPVMAADDYAVTLNIPSTWWGKSGASLTAWGLSSEAEWATDVRITSKAGDVINATATIENAPLKANRATIYKGNMYSTNSGFNISLNTDWQESYEGIY